MEWSVRPIYVEEDTVSMLGADIMLYSLSVFSKKGKNRQMDNNLTNAILERNFDGKSVTTRKGCVNELPYQTENGFKPKHDVCEVISTDSSQSLVKVCDNQDFCNSDCVPNNPTNSIQRVRQIGKGDIKTEITKGCSEDGAVIYPDESQSFTINSCEYRTINDIHYEALVCNRNKCNTGCPSLVTCECDPKDQPNCQQGLCQGLFCLYNSVKTPKNLSVAKSCVSFESLTVPNTDSYSASGTCQKWLVNKHIKTIDNVIYSYKLCRSDLCNKSCGSEIVTTTTPRTKVASATLSGALLLLLLPIMPYFMKS
uniref:DX domain-containing protein n=1 Tax=Heterorhabditis bacteriophora TaxID=37862 RepID=A0A1I7XUZ4_HETBA